MRTKFLCKFIAALPANRETHPLISPIPDRRPDGCELKADITDRTFVDTCKAPSREGVEAGEGCNLAHLPVIVVASK